MCVCVCTCMYVYVYVCILTCVSHVFLHALLFIIAVKKEKFELSIFLFFFLFPSPLSFPPFLLPNTALALGVLMNTKGLVVLIVPDICRGKKVSFCSDLLLVLLLIFLLRVLTVNFLASFLFFSFFKPTHQLACLPARPNRSILSFCDRY